MIEQMQGLEYDRKSNPWLSLSVLDVSPNQGPLDRVESKILNFKTGEIFPLPEYPEYEEEQQVSLTPREKDVLKLVREGFLSKEISDRLKISVKTGAAGLGLHSHFYKSAPCKNSGATEYKGTKQERHSREIYCRALRAENPEQPVIITGLITEVIFLSAAMPPCSSP